jgi:hypothetical protein
MLTIFSPTYVNPEARITVKFEIVKRALKTPVNAIRVCGGYIGLLALRQRVG